MDLTTVERHVLAAVHACVRGRRASAERAFTEGALEHEFQSLSRFPELNAFTASADAWRAAVAKLVTRGVLTHVADGYALAADGVASAAQCARALRTQYFGRWMTRSAASPTFHIFCERLYGRDLCQFNMVTMSQLTLLLEVLGLGADSRVLDVGCGLGTVTTYISEVTGATITGIDSAAAAIEHARRRTAREGGRLAFEVGDMDDLTAPGGRFDAIIALDTLYFAADLPATLSRMAALLAQDGQMGLFWSEVVPDAAQTMPDAAQTMPDGVTPLRSGETRLGQALARTGLRCRSWNLTREERSLWRRFVALAEALRPAFEGEGNAELYETMVEEGRDKVSHIEAGRISRYLYCCGANDGTEGDGTSS